MAREKGYRVWTVHAHGPLVQEAEGVWRIDGSLPDMPLPRRCTLVRCSDGSLLIHSGIAADARTMDQLDALGPVKWLVVPNAYHRLDAYVFKARYPQARVLCPRGATAKVREVVEVDGTLDDFPPDARVRMFHLDGVGEREGAVTVSGPDGVTLILNDALFNLEKMRGLFGFVYGTLMGNAGKPKVTTLYRRFVVKNRRAFREHLERLASIPGLQRILMSHGVPITHRAPQVLTEVARTL